MDIIEILLLISCLLIVILTVIIIYNKIEKKKLQQLLANEQPLSQATLSIDDRLEYTKNLLSFIDDMITAELINEKRFDIFLDKPNKNINFDKVLKNISNAVFIALKPEIFINNENILTKDYLMSYIQKKTFIIYFTYIQNNIAGQL